VTSGKEGLVAVEKGVKKGKSVVREYIEAIGIALIAALFIRTFIVQAFKIPSGSMLPTLQIGDHILVNKLAYGIRIPFWERYVVGFGKPKGGDVVVFVYPVDRSKDFIKRIIGVEGDRVKIRNKKVFINGAPIEDPHASFRGNSSGPPFRDHYGPRSVPKGHIFVMGDNRDSSLDSRFWGYVNLKDVKGKAFVIYWSWDGNDRWIRWERIIKLIY